MTKLIFSAIWDGPNNLWLYNQRCILSLLLLKQNAAMTAGVLQGKPGKYTPTNATARKNIPAENQSALRMFIKYLC